MVQSIFMENLTMNVIQNLNLLTTSSFLKKLKFSINFTDIIIFLSFHSQIMEDNCFMINFQVNLIISKNIFHSMFHFHRDIKVSQNIS